MVARYDTQHAYEERVALPVERSDFSFLMAVGERSPEGLDKKTNPKIDRQLAKTRAYHKLRDGSSQERNVSHSSYQEIRFT